MLNSENLNMKGTAWGSGDTRKATDRIFTFPGNYKIHFA